MIKLAIGLPAYGGKVVAEHARMFLELGHTLACSEARFEFTHHQYIDVCGIERARNALLAVAMMKGANWLFMCDADTWVEGTDEDNAGFQILRMISEAERLDATLVGAPVVRRVAQSGKRELNVYRSAADARLVSLDPAREVPDGEVRQGLFEVDAIGAACIAINLTKLTEEMSFKFTDVLSEDLEFCRQIKAAGGKVFVDGRVRTAHLSRPFPIQYEPGEKPLDVLGALLNRK